MTTTDEPEHGGTDFNSSGPKKLSETALGPSWGNFARNCSAVSYAKEVKSSYVVSLCFIIEL